MKSILKKILIVVIVVMLDILIFALCIMMVNSFNKDNTDTYTYKERETFTMEIEMTEETTVDGNKVLYEESKSPLVNWMRKVVRGIRE